MVVICNSYGNLKKHRICTKGNGRKLKTVCYQKCYLDRKEGNNRGNEWIKTKSKQNKTSVKHIGNEYQKVKASISLFKKYNYIW